MNNSRKAISARNETYDYHKLLRKVLKLVPRKFNVKETDDAIIISYDTGSITVYKKLQDIKENDYD